MATVTGLGLAAVALAALWLGEVPGLIVATAILSLATLEFAWIYNDYFWAVVLVQKGNDLPITSSLRNLSGEFFTDDNLVAAGSLIVVMPTIIIYLILRKQFIAGLSVGASKG